MKWKHFPRYWPSVRGIHRSPVDSLHKGQWRGALVFSLNCAWTNGWTNNWDAVDLRRHCAHYDVTVIGCIFIYVFKTYSKWTAGFETSGSHHKGRCKIHWNTTGRKVAFCIVVNHDSHVLMNCHAKNDIPEFLLKTLLNSLGMKEIGILSWNEYRNAIILILSLPGMRDNDSVAFS